MAEEQDSQDTQPVLRPVLKPLSLIPVGLKEAALDSPTFRSTAVHFADQIETIERWLDGYVKSASRLAQEVAVLDGLVNSFMSSAEPPNLSEAILDHDYTILSIRRYGEGARDFWSHTIEGMKTIQESMIDPIRAFLQDEVRPFKDARRHLDNTQKYFDSILTRYSGQAKTKEPSSLREDAFQLHEARKAYLRASMDYMMLAPHIRSALDRLLIKIFSDQWLRMRDFREASSASFGKHSGEVDRIRDWSREMDNGERALKRELYAARRQIEDRAEVAARPSRELDDYTASTVPYLGVGRGGAPARPSGDSTNLPSSKQGWLFMRTMTGKPTRTVWVRRWFFVKNGIFGWLVQGARSGGVEESEKIGVLLCNVRPAFQEERRFCFEVKTKDTTILLQAETQADLTHWISVFDIAKQKAFDEPSSTELLASTGAPSIDAAFAVTPAVAPELAAKRADGQITNITEDAPATLLSPDVADSAAALAARGSFDVAALRKSGFEKDGEGSRDAAARIIQKLDLHRRSGQSQNLGTSTPSSPAPPVGGIASLISASHVALPVGPRPGSAAGKPGDTDLIWSKTLAPPALVNPPAPTNLSKTAVMIGVERGFDLGSVDVNGGMPSGLMANQWGSANYGHINRVERGEVNRSKDKSQLLPPRLEKRVTEPAGQLPLASSADASGPSTTQTPEGSPKISAAPLPSPRHTQNRKATSSLDVSNATRRMFSGFADFPSYYPQSLRSHDAQFRMLFPNVPQDDRVVLVFRASWNPNENQDLPGRIFVTVNDLYFYSNHLGFVLITGLTLESILEVVAEQGTNHDLLYLHIQGKSGRDDPSIITIKTFLEPLRMLTRRLNYLVNNSSLEEPAGLEEVLTTLVNMEKGGRSGSDASEDLALPNLSSEIHRRGTDIKSGLRVDRSIYPGEGSTFIDSNDFNKFQLPSQPVVYTPRNVTNLSVEKVFEVSAKALFHIIFGDKSILSQMLYHERRAQAVTQRPWVKLDPGNYTRSFQYFIDANGRFGRARQVEIIDTQTIDVMNDHLCYVVSDRKTPWHLPRPKDFTLLTKLVITHVAKSTSKLAIFTTVDWAKKSALSHLIERRGLDDLHLDALDLLDLVIDQVQKLGPNCYTKRAVQIFGNFGQQTEASQVSVNDFALTNTHKRLAINRRTLSQLILETVMSFLASTASTILLSFIALTKAIFSRLTTHVLLLALLLGSVSLNFLSTTQAASSWWRDRSAATFMSRMGVGPNPVMSRAVYLHDLLDFSAPPSLAVTNATAAASANKCATTFQALLAQSDPDAPPSSSAAAPPEAGLPRRLHRARQRLGIHRHDLLVALRLVNRVERDAVAAAYEGWLGGEVARCRALDAAIVGGRLEKGGKGKGGEVEAWSREYCGACGVELDRVLAET